MRGEDDRKTQCFETAFCLDEGTERRAMCQVLDFWLGKIRAGRPLPAVADVDIAARPELAPHLFLIDLRHEPDRCVIVSGGHMVSHFCGQDVAGKFACEVFPASLGEQTPHLCEIVQAYGKPVPHTGTAFAAPGEVAFRAILLPLAGDTDAIDHILGSLTFRLAP